jgi:hypothetical protein
MASDINPYQILAQLRLSVLACGEALPGKCWDSDGLGKAGQADLSTVFPRTSLVAASSHAAKLAQAHHDAVTRATGVFHLFRLPTDVEASIHHELMTAIPNDHEVQGELWSELEDLPKFEAAAQEGPVNLGEIKLTVAKDISKIANTYKAAFDAGLGVVPYFSLSE